MSKLADIGSLGVLIGKLQYLIASHSALLNSQLHGHQCTMFLMTTIQSNYQTPLFEKSLQINVLKGIGRSVDCLPQATFNAT